MKSDGKESLERVLESAIVVSWPDLMRGASAALIHVEYGFAVSGAVEYLSIWSSITRGRWALACKYWMSSSTFHGTGVRFENGYRSEGLAHILESVMQNQSAFSLPEDVGRQGLIQVSTPTQEDGMAATTFVAEALSRVSSALSVTTAA